MTATARDGVGVARGCDGRVVFVEGALPGELVTAEIHTVDRRWARARVVDVLEESPHRVPIACEHHLEGCGGCDMLHVDSRAQMQMKASIVVDQLTRHGVDAPSPALRMLDADRGRTTVRAKVVDGRAGFMARSSHEVVIPDDCGAVDDGAEELLVEGRYGPADGVFIRVGARTGERLVVVNPTVDEVAVPDDVMVVGTDELDSDRRAWIHEELSGRRWRISARSFFQNRPAGAEALIDEVAEMVEALATDGPMVDAYAGVGCSRARSAPAARSPPSSGLPTPPPMPGSTWETGPRCCGSRWRSGGPRPPAWWWPTPPGPGSAMRPCAHWCRASPTWWCW